MCPKTFDNRATQIESGSQRTSLIDSEGEDFLS